jgi:hypothetical protein
MVDIAASEKTDWQAPATGTGWLEFRCPRWWLLLTGLKWKRPGKILSAVLKPPTAPRYAEKVNRLGTPTKLEVSDGNQIQIRPFYSDARCRDAMG